MLNIVYLFAQVARRKEKLDAVAKECKEAGAEVLPLYLDLSTKECNEKVVEEIIHKFGSKLSR